MRVGEVEHSPQLGVDGNGEKHSDQTTPPDGGDRGDDDFVVPPSTGPS